MQTRKPDNKHLEIVTTTLWVTVILGLIIGSQVMIYYILAGSAKASLGNNGKYILIGIIVLSFVFIGSAAVNGIKKSINKLNRKSIGTRKETA